jgi:intracellular multiplication protein IcmL
MSSSETDLQRAAAKVTKTRDAIDAAARTQRDALEKKSLVRTLIGATVLMGVSNIVLAAIAGIAVWFAMHVQPVYFVSDNGRLFPLVPLKVPYVKQSDVIKFAKETMEASNTLDFTNYRSQMEAVRSRYTKEGFSAYATGMDTNGTLPLIKGKRMNLTSSTGTGVLIGEGEQDGVYQWEVKIPLTLKLVGQNTEMPEQKFYALVRVTRVPTLDNLQGIGVMSVVTKPQ